METINDISYNDKVFAYCMKQGVDVPPMEQWESVQPTREMLDLFNRDGVIDE